MAADSTGNVIAAMDTTPFGLPALGLPTDIGFTGHVFDQDTEFVYMQSRFYDPSTGRFLSTDPEPPHEGLVNDFGRFQYGANNPFKYVDPTGRVIKLIENTHAPHASDHSMADLIADMKADPIGSALVDRLEASPLVHEITPALRRQGSSSTPTDNVEGRLQADGSKGKGSGTLVTINLGREEVKLSSTPGEAGTLTKIGPVEKGVHELMHSVQFDDGSVPDKKAIDPTTGNPAAEQPAVDMENAYREMHGMDGRREVY